MFSSTKLGTTIVVCVVVGIIVVFDVVDTSGGLELTSCEVPSITKLVVKEIDICFIEKTPHNS